MYCDNCGNPTGLNDRNFTQGGGALCDNCRQINRVYVLAELSIDLKGRDVEEVLTYLQAPINLQGLFDVQPSLIAYHVVRNGEPAETETLVGIGTVSWYWKEATHEPRTDD